VFVRGAGATGQEEHSTFAATGESHGAGRRRTSRPSRSRSHRRPNSPRDCRPDVQPGKVSRKRQRSSSRVQGSAEAAQTRTMRCSLCGDYSRSIHRHYRRAHPDTAEGRIMHVVHEVLLTFDRPADQKLEVISLSKNEKVRK